MRPDHHVEPCIDSTLSMLYDLAPNWDGDEAMAINRSTLQLLSLVLWSLAANGLPPPNCRPVADGRIDMEWSDGIICTLDDEDAVFHQPDAASFTITYPDRNLWEAFANSFALNIGRKITDNSEFIAENLVLH